VPARPDGRAEWRWVAPSRPETFALTPGWKQRVTRLHFTAGKPYLDDLDHDAIDADVIAQLAVLTSPSTAESPAVAEESRGPLTPPRGPLRTVRAARHCCPLTRPQNCPTRCLLASPSVQARTRME
jgi:hypothetical protein